MKAKGSGALGPEEDDAAQEGVQDDDESGALLMVAVCSETGSLLGLPLKSKNQMNLIAHELLALIRFCGMKQCSTTVTTGLQLGRLYASQ